MSVDVTTEALAAFIDERQAELIDFVCELVATPSPSPPGDERAAAGLVADRLRALGVAQVEVASLVPERPNVLGRVLGRGQGPTLMLCGHLDTKPPGDLGAWKTPPWDPVVDNGVLTGLGSADMKGAVGAMVYAAAAVAEVGTDGMLALAFTADEEAGGQFGARWLADEGLLQADACVIGEPSGISDDWDAIRLVSRGSALFTIRC